MPYASTTPGDSPDVKVCGKPNGASHTLLTMTLDFRTWDESKTARFSLMHEFQHFLAVSGYASNGPACPLHLQHSPNHKANCAKYPTARANLLVIPVSGHRPVPRGHTGRSQATRAEAGSYQPQEMGNIGNQGGWLHHHRTRAARSRVQGANGPLMSRSSRPKCKCSKSRA